MKRWRKLNSVTTWVNNIAKPVCYPMLYSARDIQLKYTTITFLSLLQDPIFLYLSTFKYCDTIILLPGQVSCFSVYITINMCFFFTKIFFPCIVWRFDCCWRPCGTMLERRVCRCLALASLLRDHTGFQDHANVRVLCWVHANFEIERSRIFDQTSIEIPNWRSSWLGPVYL